VRLCYRPGMDIGPEVQLEDDLVACLVDCGRLAHEIAQAHHNDPGSNGHTFGADRYHRGTELAAPRLRTFGFQARRRGAGLVASRDGLELQFAVARGTNLDDPASFDADSSPARRKAGDRNAEQLAFDGMPSSRILHVVWSGTVDEGLTAVHIGSLVSNAATDRLEWEYLTPVDGVVAAPARVAGNQAVAGTPYAEQPEPDLTLAPKTATQADEG